VMADRGQSELSIGIREFVSDDLSVALRIQTRCPQAAQWKASDYLDLARDPGGLVLVAELVSTQANPATDGTSTAKREPTGFCALHQVGDEAELRNLAVEPEYQRKGIGRALMAEAHRRLHDAGVRQVYLEARRSNVAARELYASLGYTRVLVRRGYYNQPLEDAVVWLFRLDR
jgi:ribosomal-protein-alanine acetyltransferase